MHKKWAFFLAMALLVVPLISGLPPASDDVRAMLSYMSEFKAEYNENIDNVPGWAKAILGSERLNVTLILDDNTPVNIGVILRDGMIVEMRQGRLKKPTINLFISEQTIKDILAEPGTKQRLDKIKQYHDQGLLKYQYVTFRSKVKFGSVGLAYGLFSRKKSK